MGVDPELLSNQQKPPEWNCVASTPVTARKAEAHWHAREALTRFLQSEEGRGRRHRRSEPRRPRRFAVRHSLPEKSRQQIPGALPRGRRRHRDTLLGGGPRSRLRCSFQQVWPRERTARSSRKLRRCRGPRDHQKARSRRGAHHQSSPLQLRDPRLLEVERLDDARPRECERHRANRSRGGPGTSGCPQGIRSRQLRSPPFRTAPTRIDIEDLLNHGQAEVRAPSHRPALFGRSDPLPLGNKIETSMDAKPSRRQCGAMLPDSKTATIRSLDRINLRLPPGRSGLSTRPAPFGRATSRAIPG